MLPQDRTRRGKLLAREASGKGTLCPGSYIPTPLEEPTGGSRPRQARDEVISTGTLQSGSCTPCYFRLCLCHLRHESKSPGGHRTNPVRRHKDTQCQQHTVLPNNQSRKEPHKS